MPFMVSGVGMALFFVPLASVVLSSVRPEEEGVASGANGAFREVGGVLGIAVLGAVFSARGGYTSGPAYVAGLRPAVWVGVAVVGAGAVVALMLPRRARVRETAAAAAAPAQWALTAPVKSAVTAPATSGVGNFRAAPAESTGAAVVVVPAAGPARGRSHRHGRVRVPELACDPE
jgi:hypothetical protein